MGGVFSRCRRRENRDRDDVQVPENRDHVDVQVPENRDHDDVQVPENRDHVDVQVPENWDHDDVKVPENRDHDDEKVPEKDSLLFLQKYRDTAIRGWKEIYKHLESILEKCEISSEISKGRKEFTIIQYKTLTVKIYGQITVNDTLTILSKWEVSCYQGKW